MEALECLFRKRHKSIEVDPETGCWRWTGAKLKSGYGIMVLLVHRVSHEVFIGNIPEDYEVDHLCRQRDCCNPFHLEAVSHRENNNRGESPSAKHARKTHCPKGHPYSGDNLMFH